ncbi:MAG: cysteine desulfurase NifS [Eubacteriales bacterium]
MKRHIYLDNAATTKVRKEVIDAMIPYFSDIYGNASSQHQFGRKAKDALEVARASIAGKINADPKEIFFTSGGSESDNWAIKGAAKALKNKGKHLITTSVEHHAVLDSFKSLEKQGFEVTYLPVDCDGQVSVTDVSNAIRKDTVLISIMTANNEIGTIMPIAEIGKLAKEKGILFHTDAVQAMGVLDIDVNAMDIDMLSASAHKFHGPKGVGFLYIRRGVKLVKLIDGGAQERNRRAGTENIPGIVGMAKALELMIEEREFQNKRLASMRDRMIKGLLEIPDSKLNGHITNRLPGNVNVSFDGIEGEALLVSLDMQGIAASSGSACMSGLFEPSYVLMALGSGEESSRSSIRYTIGSDNTDDEIDYAVKLTKETVEKLRTISPFYKK